MTIPTSAISRAGPLHDLLQYRELLGSLVQRDLTLRYRYAPLGVVWALLLPVATTVLFSTVFTRIVRLDVGVPYPLFAYTGLLVWYLTATAIRTASTSLSSQASLITKVYFPREILPFAALITSVADFAVAALFLVPLFAIYGGGPTWTLIALPVVIAVQLVFTAGVVLVLSMACLLYRDLRHLLDVALTLWLYVTAVLYPVDRIDGVAGALLAANPMTVIVEAYRDVLLRDRLPTGPGFPIVAALALVSLAGGWTLFRRAESAFAERV